MKVRTRILHYSVALVSLIALAVTPSRSQLNIKLGGGIGVTTAGSDLSGSTPGYYEGSNYGLAGGINILGKAKIGLAGWNLAGEIDYTSLGNSGNSEPGQGTIDISQKILTLKVGPEFRLGILALPIVPYIGANVAVNRFSGETTFQGVANVPSASYRINAATRFGVGISAGAEVSVGPTMSLDFNLAYNLMNIIGRQWVDVNPGIDQRVDSYLSLNDVRDPQYVAGNDKHFVSSDRSIRSFLLTASILFGL